MSTRHLVMICFSVSSSEDLPDGVENGKETTLEGALKHLCFLIKKNNRL